VGRLVLLSFLAAALGWRFFPRYFFQLLPPMVLLAARGACLMPLRIRDAVIGLGLLVPLVRFGPAMSNWPGTSPPAARAPGRYAMDRDSRAAAALTRSLAQPADTLFVWGFRPEMYIYTGLPAASRFLDSQPLTGVPADRHLVDSTPVAPELAAANRPELARTRPDLILDGLGLYNPALAIGKYPDLQSWLAEYQVVGHTTTTNVYRRNPTLSQSTSISVIS